MVYIHILPFVPIILTCALFLFLSTVDEQEKVEEVDSQGPIWHWLLSVTHFRFLPTGAPLALRRGSCEAAEGAGT
jgi:hypothetical protein